MENNQEISPGSQALAGNIMPLETWAQVLVVTTPPEYTVAIDRLREVKGVRQRVVDFFKGSKDSAYATWKAIVANEKKFTDRLDGIEQRVKAACTTFQREQERKAEEGRLKAQAEADEFARLEREKLEALAKKARSPEKKAALKEQAASVIAPVVHIAAEIPVVAGASTRDLWKFEVINADILPRQWLMPNERALADFARSTKGRVAVPGVRFYAEQSMAVTKGS